MLLNEKQQADVLMKAYGALRTEILSRMKTAFSHLGYVGAIIAFVVPLSEHAEWYHWLAGAIGLALLIWIAVINWLWLRNCASHLRHIESKMHALSPGLLTWESRAEMLTMGVLFPPVSYETVFGRTPGVELQVLEGSSFYFVAESDGEYSSSMSPFDTTIIAFTVRIVTKGRTNKCAFVIPPPRKAPLAEIKSWFNLYRDCLVCDREFPGLNK